MKKRRGRPPKNANTVSSTTAAPVDSSEPAKSRRKASSSPDALAKKHSKHGSNSSRSRTAKENDENSASSGRRHSHSPTARKTNRRRSSSPTNSLPGRPARKNTLNQRLQQRRASQESVGSSTGSSASEKRRRSSRDSCDSKDSFKHRTEQVCERQSRSTQKRKNVSSVKVENLVAADELNMSCEGSDSTVDLNEAEHVSVIKRNKSPENYRKNQVFTDWAKQAEEQQMEWERAVRDDDVREITTATEDTAKQRTEKDDGGVVSEGISVSISEEKTEKADETPTKDTNGSAKNADITMKEMDSSVSKPVPPKEPETRNCVNVSSKQSGTSPVRSVTTSPHKRQASPKTSGRSRGHGSPEGLWTGNVRPGHRDWSRERTYGRKKPDGCLGSVKRSRAEDNESTTDKTKKLKAEIFQCDIKEDVNGDVEAKGESSRSPREGMSRNSATLERQSSLSPSRTPPCAVSLPRLNIQRVTDVVHVDSLSDSKPSTSSNNSGADPRVRSEVKEKDTKAEVTKSGSGSKGEAGSASSCPSVMLVDSLHSDDDRLSSPPRVTRSRERSASKEPINNHLERASCVPGK